MILAAGRGKRMKGLTETVPKPMLPLRGKPMLEHILDRLRAAGFRKALVVTGYKAETIENHLASYPMEIEFVRQQEVNGTGRAALLGREFAGADPFLLTFGDILTEPEDYRGIARRLEEDGEAAGVVAVKWVEDPAAGAAVYERGGVIERVVEKPKPGTSTTHWNSAGSWAFRREIFTELERIPLSPRGEYELTTAVEQLLERKRRVLVYALEGSWRDVGRPDDLEAAEGLVGG